MVRGQDKRRMKRLNYELRNMWKRNREGARTTQKNRYNILQLVANQLAEVGFQTREMSVHDLKGRHVNRLVALWKKQGISDVTMKNRLAVVRWWAEKTGNPGAVKTNEEYLTPQYGAVTDAGSAYLLKQVDTAPPLWSEDTPDVRPVHDRENSPFVTRILREEGMSVCLDRVTGHDDLRYQGMSWRELSEQTRTRGISTQPESVICVSEDGVYWTVTHGLSTVCRARFQYDREGCLPVLQGVSLTTLTVDTVMKEACAELADLLSNPSFPVSGKIIAFRGHQDIQEGPGWRCILYQPQLDIQLYGDTTGRLPEKVTCHHVRDVYRLLSALHDADRDIRTARKAAASRSWWSTLTGRVPE
ncbi:hypothetical protein E8Q24_27445 [Salmonella enterica]|nr:hypothetical protein [Salmonella enterica subsp. enterica serovar Dahomey]